MLEWWLCTVVGWSEKKIKFVMLYQFLTPISLLNVALTKNVKNHFAHCGSLNIFLYYFFISNFLSG